MSINTDDFKVPEDINEYNILLYNSRRNGVYWCTQCKERTSLSGSYSNVGLHLTCCGCVYEGSKRENLSTAAYVSKHIWEAPIPDKYLEIFSNSPFYSGSKNNRAQMSSSSREDKNEVRNQSSTRR